MMVVEEKLFESAATEERTAFDQSEANKAFEQATEASIEATEECDKNAQR